MIAMRLSDVYKAEKKGHPLPEVKLVDLDFGLEVNLRSIIR